jgi:flagellar L-ring protein precursor FlgH
MKRTMTWIIAFALMAAGPGELSAQSSSNLKLRVKPPPPPRLEAKGRSSKISRAIAQHSFAAVSLPPPRKFAVQDLITIIIRESVEAESRATLDTEKSLTIEGEISEFPKLSLRDLLNLDVKPSSFSAGTPKVGVEFDNEFEGEGQRNRSDSIVTRLTGRIIDIKPNGTFVIEGRKFLKTDRETTALLVTGTCRPQDITPTNTILSTLLSDLHVSTEHTGELKKASSKGLITKVFEAIFNF